MPNSRLALILAGVVLLAAGTIWLAVSLGAQSLTDPLVFAVVVPATLVLTYLLRRK